MRFNADGVATVTLKGGDSKVISGLPYGVTYAVTETNTEGFDVAYEGQTGTISAEPATATVKNTRKVGNLKLTKNVVSDASADKNVDFTFHVELGEPVTGKFGDMEFDADGKATVVLKDGESATAEGLPS